MIQLHNITLVAVSSIRINETIIALIRSSSNIQFNSVKLISHELPQNLPSNIIFEPCELLDNINKYNYYIIYNLIKHIQTEYCLLIQYDGYVLRPEKWEDEFLKYDYIGAPWPYSNESFITKSGEHIRVGNGGFSLRSKKLLDAPIKFNIPFLNERGFYNEDGNICVYNRDKFLELGIKYAPLDVACRFSHELDIEENKNIFPFGFHRHIK